MGSVQPPEVQCWAALVTKPSYLPGVIILAHSLDQQGSQSPLVVQYPASLGKDAIKTLREEGERTGRIIPHEVELLIPRPGQETEENMAAERFKDTYTKLRVFQLYEFGYTKVCFLDADMAVFQNPDSIFDHELPGRDWLGANHACVCNLDDDGYASPDWQKGNCAFTTIRKPTEIVADIAEDSRPTYKLLNGGLLLFHPTEALWKQMLHTFNTSEKIKDYQFPDQDFLADFFRGKWQPVSRKFNALKTMRYWHPEMWSDDLVTVLHYIVDKPWERRVSEGGCAGYLGRDGETHRWWWKIHQDWLKTQQDATSITSRTMRRLVDTSAPFTEIVPMPQVPEKFEDVLPYP